MVGQRTKKLRLPDRRLWFKEPAPGFKQRRAAARYAVRGFWSGQPSAQVALKKMTATCLETGAKLLGRIRAKRSAETESRRLDFFNAFPGISEI